MNVSENVWEDEMTKVKITIEVTENTDGGDTTWEDILKQAEYCIKGLGYEMSDAPQEDSE